MSFQRATLDAFFNHVKVGEKPTTDLTPCWLFFGADAYSGYKAFRCVLAHRAAAAIYTGRFPGRVSHICKNKHCVRYEHLKINTSDGPRERKRKSRLTGRTLAGLVTNDPDTIKRVLDSRPMNKIYSVATIAQLANTTINVVRAVLREAAIYDLIEQVKEISIWSYLDNRNSLKTPTGLGQATQLPASSDGCDSKFDRIKPGNLALV